MGNCQAAGDAVGVTVEHPDGKVERLYWSVAARQVMLQYPGHYVALVPPRIPTSRKSEVPFPPSNQMKLLPPHGMLQVGQHYRLISFEDVLLEMSEKKRFGGRSSSGGSRSKRVHSEHLSCGVDDDEENMEPNADEDDGEKKFGAQLTGRTFDTMRSFSRSGQWRPALQSISEIGR
ncbi:hypothetical protein MPTK1_8g17700 [Marchantia polymorpha subsp. ruderalis]|uniref:DUF4228 domain protein n=1 Tax=Marchantia polymorpha TaxID=3197 RepID=A0A2R6X8E6_MARPO|nr:hypothetical protein MARPO_0030s0105 [Marchantia polymorpha]BBN20253.1 hypothetical protein Mp_8g17700 [Marchantia polymorpha subsp. ruderalis]|eukprot:PTQ42373.1 hypothetical protein MARPO_0030s0105 [Marchantia polymorpha]